MRAGDGPVEWGCVLQDILESEWTLAAVKRREEERLSSERAAREGDAPTIHAPHAPDMSGDHWIAAAFRRRQEEERARAASHQPSGDRADAAGREVPVDNWLIEGFKRHQEEERRLEIIGRSDEAGDPAVGDDDATSPSMRALVVVEKIGASAPGGSASRAAGADGQVASVASGALVARDGERALTRRPKGVGRLIAIAGVIVVGLVSVFGLKTALWNLGESPHGFDRGTPNVAPQPKTNPPPKTGVAPPPKPARPAANSGAPTGDSPTSPADVAPSKPGDAATLPAPSAQPPQGSTQKPAAPSPQPEPQAPAPSADKPPQGDRAMPAPNPAAPTPPGAKDAASPAKPDKDSAASPASGGSENLRDGGSAEQDHTASDPQRHAPDANSDAKPKQQAKGKNGARHSSGRSDGFSTFLKRTANSVRRFFGRLGARQ